MSNRVLIVEDYEYKANKIKNAILEYSPEIKVDVAQSYTSGLQTLRKNNYDFVVLDVTLPTTDISSEDDGAEKRKFGGYDILRKIVRKTSMPPCIFITQFDSFKHKDGLTSHEELNTKIQDLLNNDINNIIHFDNQSSNWKKLLKEKLKEVLQ